MKRIACVTIIIVLLASYVCISFAEERRIIDGAAVFTEDQIDSLEKRVKLLQQKCGLDFVIVTSKEDYPGESVDAIASLIYDDGNFGLGDDRSGFLFLIDMHNGKYAFHTVGKMKDYLSARRTAIMIEVAIRHPRNTLYETTACIIELVYAFALEGPPHVPNNNETAPDEDKEEVKSDEIAQLQQRLYDLCYYGGETTGELDALTQNAIEDFAIVNFFDVPEPELDLIIEYAMSDECLENTIVYIPKSGHRYHAINECSHMDNPRQSTAVEAARRGYLPCKDCFWWFWQNDE